MALHTFPHISPTETACLQEIKALAPGHLGPSQNSATNSPGRQSTCSAKRLFHSACGGASLKHLYNDGLQDIRVRSDLSKPEFALAQERQLSMSQQ